MADPLLETIAKALHEKSCYFYASPYSECRAQAEHLGDAEIALAALLSDAGSTQWGVRYEHDGLVVPMHHGEGEARAWVEAAPIPCAVVRRQVLELHGDWEDVGE